jgi:hypothetical protein
VFFSYFGEQPEIGAMIMDHEVSANRVRWEKILGISGACVVLILIGYMTRPMIDKLIGPWERYAVVTENISLRDHALEVDGMKLPSTGTIVKGTVVKTTNLSDGKKMYFEISDWGYDYQLKFIGDRKAVKAFMKEQSAPSAKRPRAL